MPQKQKVELAVVDQYDVKKLGEKKKKIQQVVDIIKEYGLEKDEEFMKEVYDAVEDALR
jgi:hypothetical protein